MGGAGDRIRDVVHRGVRRGGVVFGVGKEARVRSVRGVPDCCGGGGFVLGVAIGGIAGFACALCYLQTRILKVFAGERLVFGIIVLFGGSSRRDYASASARRDTQPSPKS